MEFYTGKAPFRGIAPMFFSEQNESQSLTARVGKLNEATARGGLKYLRSFLSNVAVIPGFEKVKDVYAAVNSASPSSAISISKVLLTQSYESAEEHFAHAQIACFVKKYPFEGSVSIRRENALRKFLRGERRNRHMNALIRRRRIAHDKIETSDGKVLSYGSFDPNPFVGNMRKYITRVIGSSPCIGDMFDSARWGPGAVVGVNGQFTHFARKLLSKKWTVTPAAIPYALTVCKRFPMFWELLGLTKTLSPELQVTCIDSEEFDIRFNARLVVVQHNKIAFVPKDADCDRTIASEPLINQFLQLAVDGWMKKMLAKVGLDLTKQRPNQLMAREGSRLSGFNPYCTADLKNASGSIFTEVVKELFPPAWFVMLNALRSPSWMIDNREPEKYHGFVSMGNGYCFPVETLIFASICSAAHVYTGTTPDFRVYGDDIIVRQNESGILQEYLRYFGFELNPDKSFFFGPFRESCGADWYDGEPVRPVYFDDALDTLEQRIRAHNALVRLPNELAGPLAHACRNWFPYWISKFCRPFAGETDEAVDNRFATVPSPWHMRNKTLQCPAWYGLSFASHKDSEIESDRDYHIAYKYGACLSGGNPDKPFTMRRETRVSVKRFYHGGGLSQDFPYERNCRETAYWSSYPGRQLDEHVRLFSKERRIFSSKLLTCRLAPGE